MKNIFFLFLFVTSSFCISAQTSSVFGVESNYTVQNGYRYFFDKINPSTGAYTQIAQLPVNGFYTNIKFINCYGNYVFLGVDTAAPSSGYYFRLYEVDTATGVVVRSIPTDTGFVAKLEVCLPSSNGSNYYGIRNLPTGEFRLVSINAITGVFTTISTTPILNQVVAPDNSVITLNDQIWFGTTDWNNTNHYLYHVNTSNGQFTKADSLSFASGNNYIYLFYNCFRDSIYGILVSSSSFMGAPLIKIGQNGQVIQTGNFINVAGTGYTSDYTMLTDGRLYFRGTSSDAYIMDSISGMTTIVPFPDTADIKLFAAPRMACFPTCNSQEGVSEIPNDQFISLYPNPIEDGFFTLKMEGEMKVEIIDYSGRVVLMENGKDEIRLNVSTLPAAMYGVRISSGEKISFGKIVVLK
ncbi:MAG: T9SS type A sorting domain-containing protein [Bacteroidetes bacterium]|nr:T9SS type A sorting domain-containing protein [Bacteroidota bacterium]